MGPEGGSKAEHIIRVSSVPCYILKQSRAEMGAFHSRTCNPDHMCPDGRSHLEQSTGKAKRSEPSRDACTKQ